MHLLCGTTTRHVFQNGRGGYLGDTWEHQKKHTQRLEPSSSFSISVVSSYVLPAVAGNGRARPWHSGHQALEPRFVGKGVGLSHITSELQSAVSELDEAVEANL